MKTTKLNINPQPNGKEDNVELYLRELIKYDVIFKDLYKYLIKANITPCVSFATSKLIISKKEYNRKMYKVDIGDGIRVKEFLIPKILNELTEDDILDFIDLKMMKFLHKTIPSGLLITQDILNAIVESELPFNNNIFIKLNSEEDINEISNMFNLSDKPVQGIFCKNYLELKRDCVNWYSSKPPSGSLIINKNQFETNEVLNTFINYMINSGDIYLDTLVQSHFNEVHYNLKKYKDLTLL